MSQETVSHSGTILSVDPQFIKVEIVSESGCSSCHAQGLCGVWDQKVKEVMVPTPVSEFYEPGEEVWVDLKASMGYKAVWIAYAVPLVILVSVIMVLLLAGVGELAAGLTGIAAVAVYYFVVWLLRERLRDQYIFTIRKKNTY